MENIPIFRADLFCKMFICYFHVPHIGFHNYSKLIHLFGLLYTPIAHEVLPVSLVDSVTAKVDDEKKTLQTVYTSPIHHVVYFSNKLFIYFLYVFYVFYIYILYTSHTHWRSRWRSKRGDQKSWRWSKKHFFPKMFGDLWGVICYHHWYPRAGLEGREKSYFSKKVSRSKKCRITPWVFSMRRFGLNPYLELIYQLFEKSDFRYFRDFLGPLGPNYQSFLSGGL